MLLGQTEGLERIVAVGEMVRGEDERLGLWPSVSESRQITRQVRQHRQVAKTTIESGGPRHLTSDAARPDCPECWVCSKSLDIKKIDGVHQMHVNSCTLLVSGSLIATGLKTDPTLGEHRRRGLGVARRLRFN